MIRAHLMRKQCSSSNLIVVHFGFFFTSRADGKLRHAHPKPLAAWINRSRWWMFLLQHFVCLINILTKWASSVRTEINLEFPGRVSYTFSRCIYQISYTFFCFYYRCCSTPISFSFKYQREFRSTDPFIFAYIFINTIYSNGFSVFLACEQMIFIRVDGFPPHFTLFVFFNRIFL